MIGLSLTLAVGLALLVLHLGALVLIRALRTYSRSQLEAIGAARGRPELADRIGHLGERTERGAEAIAVLTALGLAGVLATLAVLVPPRLPVAAVVGLGLAAAGLGRLAVEVIGRVEAERLLVRLWPVTAGVRVVTAPLTALMRGVEALAYRRSHHASNGPRPASVEVEIHHPGGDEAQEDGGEVELPEATRARIERAIELAHRDVYEVLTPRSSILALPASTPAAEAARAFVDSGFSRIPLFGEHRDDIVGVLYTKDLFARLLDAPEPRALDLRKLARPALFVPETKNAAELLDELRDRKVQMAIVLDEYGGVAGLVTLEDLLEQLVGEIHDEHDIPVAIEPVVPLGGSKYEVDAALPLVELNERLGLRLPTDEDFSTIGGLAFSTLGHLPDPGASFRRDGVEFTVLEVESRSIRRLRIDLHPAAALNGR